MTKPKLNKTKKPTANPPCYKAPPDDDWQAFALVRSGDDTWWHQESPADGRLYNRRGGYQYFEPKHHTVLDRTLAREWQDLDWTKVDPPLIDPKSRGGWLAPDGTWYGCAPEHHETIARYILGSDGFALEKTHCHVYAKSATADEVWSKPDKGLTRAQLEWLSKNNYEYADLYWDDLDK